MDGLTLIVAKLRLKKYVTKPCAAATEELAGGRSLNGGGIRCAAGTVELPAK